MTTLHDALSERKALAEAAAPGPWQASRNDSWSWDVDADDVGAIARCQTGDRWVENALHIAANDPTTVALMLAVIEAVEAENAAQSNLSSWVQAWKAGEVPIDRTPARVLDEAIQAKCAALDALREHVRRERAGE